MNYTREEVQRNLKEICLADLNKGNAELVETIFDFFNIDSVIGIDISCSANMELSEYIRFKEMGSEPATLTLDNGNVIELYVDDFKLQK